jgi:hypothetical protein
MMDKVQKLASEYLRLAKQHGCGDGGCVIYIRGGQHTNGGCRCVYRMDVVREREVARLLRQAQALSREVLGGVEDEP